MKKTLSFVIVSCMLAFSAVAQESLLSDAENYYGFLSLDGHVERPYLNYRTLSDSEWKAPDPAADPWAGYGTETTKEIGKGITYRLYGPDFFSSFNATAPYGQNDGALWQGKGLNASLSAGARLEGFGIELTVKPDLAFSQNLAFELTNPAYAGPGFAGKADTWGYYGVPNIDAPQRFGDKALFAYDWGDSEVRYAWKTLTAGFGTQAIWLGPARVNPILHSNNAPSYPKFDIGLRKTAVSAFGANIGFIEGRVWCGYLSESDFFDNDDTNNNNMISGISASFAPDALPGLTLGANRVYLAKWEKESIKTVPSLLFIKWGGSGGDDVWDQRASLSFSWFLPDSGFEAYGEVGINDWVVGNLGYIRYPFHTIVYMGGFAKTFPTFSDSVRGELTFEWSNLELSQDFQFQWPATFYSHGLISQGYTNGGQWLGSGIGTGGNSQYLGCSFYYPKGTSKLFVYRVNPDNDYLYAKSINTTKDPATSTNLGTEHNFYKFKASFAIGAETLFHVSRKLDIGGGAAYNLIMNPQYEFVRVKESVLLNNAHCSLSAKVNL